MCVYIAIQPYKLTKQSPGSYRINFDIHKDTKQIIKPPTYKHLRDN